jgi:hypothetical protein
MRVKVELSCIAHTIYDVNIQKMSYYRNGMLCMERREIVGGKDVVWLLQFLTFVDLKMVLE